MPKLPKAQEVQLLVELDAVQNLVELRAMAQKKTGLSSEEIAGWVVSKRSIDARARGKMKGVKFAVQMQPPISRDYPSPQEVRMGREPPVLIVGAGPAGIFCAHELARHRVPSVIIERGKTVQPRRHDLKKIHSLGEVNPDSNYCFGEGGAGTYSDGKLYTRASKRGDVHDVLDVLVKHGAPEDILVDARPHIGSNTLPKILEALRNTLTGVGVQYRFETTLASIETTKKQHEDAFFAARTRNGDVIPAQALVLATGHSARDVFSLAEQARMHLEAKPFALGMRIEHAQAWVNEAQYGADANHPSLPNAYYRIVEQAFGHGVFSFCMCPGGFIIPASTDKEELVVNGMSLKRRDSPYANSGIVTTVELEDMQQYSNATGVPLLWAGLELQRSLEQAAYRESRRRAGKGNLMASMGSKAQDFIHGKVSSGTFDSSYVPGVWGGDYNAVFDGVGALFAERLKQGLKQIEKKVPGYASTGILVGLESRTSSPIRMWRDPVRLESNVRGVYPTGEGAGYAGGIMSAALDGIRVARAIIQKHNHPSA